MKTMRGVDQMSVTRAWYLLGLVCFVVLLIPSTSLAQIPPDIMLVYDHQDPAGDVLKYNSSVNGEAIADISNYDSLDFKWVHSEPDGNGNIVLTMDLKSKNKFTNEDETKYVFRMLTAEDNSTGYNITYTNETAVLVPFSPAGNGTAVDIYTSVSFDRDRGDEIMRITLSIVDYLSGIEFFKLDAYSMKTLNNTAYIDYISELPGHPEYINPDVAGGENIDGGDTGNSKTEDSGTSMVPVFAIIGVVVLLVLILLIWLIKKQKK